MQSDEEKFLGSRIATTLVKRIVLLEYIKNYNDI